MPRLIDADELKKAIKKDIMGGLNYEWYIDHAPTVDAVEVVRCRDCRFYTEQKGANPKWRLCERTNCYRMRKDYCSRGERRDDDR